MKNAVLALTGIMFIGSLAFAGNIQGQVVYKESGDPAGYASVYLRTWPSCTDVDETGCNAQGQFGFQGLEPGTYILFAYSGDAWGWKTCTVGMGTTHVTIEIEENPPANPC